MIVSQRDFLMYGHLGDVRLDMPAPQIEALLGPPDDVDYDYSSGKRKYPTIYVYGSMELAFSRPYPHKCESIGWQAAERGDFRVNENVVVTDYRLRPGMSRRDVDSELAAMGITYTALSDDLPTFRIAIDERVTLDQTRLACSCDIYFEDDEDVLHAVWVSWRWLR
jgi:hypothetical protein